jgi:hypothetical protein
MPEGVAKSLPASTPGLFLIRRGFLAVFLLFLLVCMLLVVGQHYYRAKLKSIGNFKPRASILYLHLGYLSLNLR